jgi:hypothetical protein
MGQKKITSDQCAYCIEPSETKDHVPPKLLFPKPRPSDLITVPSCLRCNSKAGIDEEYFLGVHMFSEAALSDAGKALWKQKLVRTYRKNRGLRNLLARSLIQVRIWTPNGLYLGTREGITLDHGRLDRVVQKIIRGLYYHEYQDRILEKTRVDCMRLDTQEKLQQVTHLAKSVHYGSRNWPGLFEYRCNRVPENPQGSLWFMRFYGRIHYWGFTTPIELDSE